MASALIESLDRSAEGFIASAGATARACWRGACERDRLPGDNLFVVFSKGNPVVSYYEKVLWMLWAAIQQRRAFGYVGLTMGGARAGMTRIPRRRRGDAAM